METKAERVRTAEEIAKDNAAFALMSRSEQRVTLAKDVLEQLKLGKLKATRGTYFDHSEDITVTSEDSERDLSEFLPKIAECSVCAIGSLFVCAVLRADKLKIGHEAVLRAGPRPLWELSWDEHYYVGQFFDRDMRDEMEGMFETGVYENNDGDYYEMQSPWWDEPADRMTWIMENVIANGGNFKLNWIHPKTPE